MKSKAIPPFTLTAGQRGRLVFEFTLPDGAETPTLRGAVKVAGKSVSMTAVDGGLVIPTLPAGVYLAEVRAGAACVLYGHVEVLPSPLADADGETVYNIAADLTTDVLAVNITMAEGLPGRAGASAYEIAVANGFEGDEAAWLESLKGGSLLIDQLLDSTSENAVFGKAVAMGLDARVGANTNYTDSALNVGGRIYASTGISTSGNLNVVKAATISGSLTCSSLATFNGGAVMYNYLEVNNDEIDSRFSGSLNIGNALFVDAADGSVSSFGGNVSVSGQLSGGGVYGGYLYSSGDLRVKKKAYLEGDVEVSGCLSASAGFYSYGFADFSGTTSFREKTYFGEAQFEEPATFNGDADFKASVRVSGSLTNNGSDVVTKSVMVSQYGVSLDTSLERANVSIPYTFTNVETEYITVQYGAWFLAPATFSGNTAFSGAVSVSGLFTCAGDADFTGDLTKSNVDVATVDDVSALLPVGSIVPSLADSMAGYLRMDGEYLLSRTAYPELFAAVGTKFGTDDAGLGFYLPDMSGRTLWGADATSPLGTTLEAGLPDVRGSMLAFAWGNGDTYEAITSETQSEAVLASGTATYRNNVRFRLRASDYNAIYGASSTVQPPAVAVNYFIRTGVTESVVCDCESVLGDISFVTAGVDSSLIEVIVDGVSYGTQTMISVNAGLHTYTILKKDTNGCIAGFKQGAITT